jgi:gluconolactonase
MRCDARGNLFVARHQKGTVAMLAPTGELLREVQLAGKRPTNLAFGGPDGRTVYVTVADRGAIEMFRAEFPGRSWLLWQ